MSLFQSSVCVCVCGKVHITVQTLVWSLHSSMRLMFHHSHWMNENVYVWPMGVSLSVWRGKQGHRSVSPWLDLDTDLVMCNEGCIDIGGLCGLSVVYPRLILFSEVSLVSQ